MLALGIIVGREGVERAYGFDDARLNFGTERNDACCEQQAGATARGGRNRAWQSRRAPRPSRDFRFSLSP